MIYLLNIFIYLLTPLGGVLSYCSLLRIAFDGIFGALLFLQCLFSLHMFVFMLPWIFYLRNFSLWHFRVRNDERRCMESRVNHGFHRLVKKLN
jgi:hypothetical protein